MLNNEFLNRNQYIRTNNELNKKVDSKIYIKGNQKKVELDKKLAELSIQNGVLVSGHLVRQNILNSSASKMNSIPYVVDSEVTVASESKRTENDNSVYVSPSYEKYMNCSINKGKAIIDSIRNDDIRQDKILDKFHRRIERP